MPTTTTTTPSTCLVPMDSAPAAQDHSEEMAFLDIPSFLCCCSILDETLGPNQHLPDCEMQTFNGEFSLPVSDERPSGDASDASSGVRSHGSTRESPSKLRKHRESMARLRKKLRESIGTLQKQEQQLAHTLQHSLTSFRPESQPSPQQKLQLAYFKLVKEQIALQNERRNLKDTWAHQDKYARLVDRELDRCNAAAQEFANSDQF